MHEVTDPVIKAFLDSQTREGTRRSYGTLLRLYLRFTQKTGRELIEEKKNDKDFVVEDRLALLRKFILDDGKSTNYVSTAIGCIRGFYNYYRCPLVIRRTDSKKLVEHCRVTEDYHFDKEDFEKLSKNANLKEKYVLFVGKSVGLRASDFVRLTYGQYRGARLDNEAPVSIGEIITFKRKEKAYPFLDSDALQVVKDWLELNKPRHDSDRVFEDTEDNLSLILQNLCKKNGYEIEGDKVHGKRIRFQCMRKFLSERLSAYASESQWKQIIGKAIDEGAYIGRDQLRSIYLRAMKDISIGNGNGLKTKKLVELENALVESQKRLTSLEITNEVMRKELADVNAKWEYFVKLIVVADFVKTPEDRQKLWDFYDTWRAEKEEKERLYQQRQDDEFRSQAH